MSASSEIPAGRKTQVRPRGYIENYRPQARTVALLQAVADILDEYRAYWPLTVRQVFYRLVSTSSSYVKTETFYGKLGHHLANARRARLIPFHAIRDDGQTNYALDHFDDEEHFLRHVRELGEGYTRNKLTGQPVHVEAWCEAAGMVPQLYDIAGPYSVPVYSSSGFDSLTAKKRLADRICKIGKPTIILHLGDYDPSGESIFTVVAEDVAAFVKADKPWATVTVHFERVGLTKEQVLEYELPTAPPKASDSRSKSWDGETCQLEALPPDVIADLLRAAIERHVDTKIRNLDLYLEQLDRRAIARALPAPTLQQEEDGR